MSSTLKQIRNKMVPDSAKEGAAIENQWQTPVSYDIKAMRAMLGKAEVVADIDDMNKDSDNFKAQDSVKKNTKLPLKEYNEAVPSTPGYAKVDGLYQDESLDLLDEIMEYLDDDDLEFSSYVWRDFAMHLKSARDSLIQGIITESEDLAEAHFKAGPCKLQDGKSVNLNAKQAASMNSVLSGTKQKDTMLSNVLKSKGEFESFIKFSTELKEHYTDTITSLLETATIDQLDTIISGELSESEVWAMVEGMGTGILGSAAPALDSNKKQKSITDAKADATSYKKINESKSAALAWYKNKGK